MVSFKQAVVVGLTVLLAVSCSGDDEEAEVGTSTTAAAPTITTLAENDDVPEVAAAETTTTTTTTTTEPPELSFPEYRIVSRESTESGDVVVVLLDPETYESLSDLDIHNVMSDLVEQFSPVYTAYVVESQAAVDALFVENPSEEEQTALDTGYLARLEEGFRIVYVGRFADSAPLILGS